jgi:hypothetical protein
VDALPDWERGTVGVLCVHGPHAIPVSTATRAGDGRILLALGGERESLERLRADPGVALCLLGPGFAFSVYGAARVLEQELAVAPNVTVVELRVERLQDHLADGRTDLLGGVRWRWRDAQVAETDRELLDELDRMAG